MPLTKATAFSLLLGATLFGISSALLYILLKKDDDLEDEEFESIQRSRNITIDVKIPKESVGVVIGRAGSNIKEIQEKTNTKINFKDELEGETYRVCSVRGTTEGAQAAESMIHDIIINQPLITTSEMYVPQRACGRIIGRNGENIRGISRTSLAKITVENLVNSAEPNSQRRILIKGTADQIELAKLLIQEKVDEDNEIRKKLEESLAQRSPRKKDKHNFLMDGTVEKPQPEKHPSETLTATSRDGFMDVYVSAVEDPDCFWVQVIGPRSVELDHLVEKMTEYYEKPENQELHLIKELNKSKIVAAPFPNDGKWYRAEVTDIKLDEYDPMESDVSLYFVDYGDFAELKQKQVMELSTEFLQLRFQAIECSLAKVKPVEDKWSSEAVDVFEELTYCAQWQVIFAKVHSHKTRTYGRREGSPIPCVELYDTKGVQDVNIGEELVRKGYAVREKEPSPAKQDSDLTKSTSHQAPQSLGESSTIANHSKSTASGGSNSQNIPNENSTSSSFHPDFSNSESESDLEMG